MWVYTTDGFFSVVHKDYLKEDELIVRAREVQDLVRLISLVEGITIKDIQFTPEADYHYRLVMKKKTWAAYLRIYALGIEYTSFKSQVAKVLGKFRADGLISIWSAIIYAFGRKY